MKIDTLKKFVKTHKPKILIGSAVAATLAVGVYIGKNTTEDSITILTDSTGEFMLTATEAGVRMIQESGGGIYPDFEIGTIAITPLGEVV